MSSSSAAVNTSSSSSSRFATGNPTPAQEEFASFLSKNSVAGSSSHGGSSVHPEDRRAHAREQAARHHDDEDEEDRFREAQIEQAMRLPTFDRLTMASGPTAVVGAGAGGVIADADAIIKLPPASFDSGRATGVKGVIADARSYEMARRSRWMSRVRAARQSVFGTDPAKAHGNVNGHGNKKSLSLASRSDSDDDSDSALNDEEAFLREWRESRRRELEAESAGPMIRTRRTSPSVRIFGRLDTVDAMGYLDAIEKVGRETVVLVFVYDHEVR